MWGWRGKGVAHIKVEVIKIMLVYVLECVFVGCVVEMLCLGHVTKTIE
jgi:hypothetical protein